MLQLLAIIKVENEMLTVKCAVRSVVALQGSFVVITGNLMGVVIWYTTIPVFATCRSKPLQATVSSPMASWPRQWPFSGPQYSCQAMSLSVCEYDLLTPLRCSSHTMFPKLRVSKTEFTLPDLYLISCSWISTNDCPFLPASQAIPTTYLWFLPITRLGGILFRLASVPTFVFLFQSPPQRPLVDSLIIHAMSTLYLPVPGTWLNSGEHVVEPNRLDPGACGAYGRGLIFN